MKTFLKKEEFQELEMMKIERGLVVQLRDFEQGNASFMLLQVDEVLRMMKFLHEFIIGGNYEQSI